MESSLCCSCIIYHISLDLVLSFFVSVHIFYDHVGSCIRFIIFSSKNKSNGLTVDPFGDLKSAPISTASCRQPLVYLLLFYASRLDPEGLAGSTGSMKTSGRHLRLMGKLKVTGSLLPLRQTALLTTFMETLFFWSPLVPLLSLNLAMHLCQMVFKSDLWVATFRRKEARGKTSPNFEALVIFPLSVLVCL